MDDGKVRTLEEVGKYLQMSRERVRQIETAALRKLQQRAQHGPLKGFIPDWKMPVPEQKNKRKSTLTTPISQDTVRVIWPNASPQSWPIMPDAQTSKEEEHSESDEEVYGDSQAYIEDAENAPIPERANLLSTVSQLEKLVLHYPPALPRKARAHAGNNQQQSSLDFAD